MRKEKQIVRDYYDNYGWHKNETGLYYDTASFVDTRPELGNYYHKVRLRLKRYLKSSGRYFLYAGSGAVPHPEYLEYSSGFDKRVCLDLVMKALLESRLKLKEESLYILADVIHLPFRDGVFDSIVSTAVLFHVPADEQMTAVEELYRSLNDGGQCVITYSNPLSLASKIATLPTIRQIIKTIIKKIPGLHYIYRKFFKPATITSALRTKPMEASEPPLYFYAHDYRWFSKVLPHNWDAEIVCWRFVGQSFLSRFASGKLGRVLLWLLFRIENIFPHLLASVGERPMIVIRKKKSTP